MKTLYRLLLSCLLLFIAGLSYLQAQTPEIAWAKQANGRVWGTVPGSSQAVAHDASGNTYITGSFLSNLSFGSTTLYSSGGDDIFIAKYDPAGNVLWAQSAGGDWNDTGFGIAVDGSGNVYITGSFNGTASFGSTTLTGNSTKSDIFVAKLDTDGTMLWAQQAGGTEHDAGVGIAVDKTGNVYLTGYIAGTASFGSTTLTGNGTDMATFAAKYDAAGNVRWAQRFQGAGGIMPYNYFYNSYSIATDDAGNVYITGNFSGTAAFGNITLTSAGGSDDIYLAKLDAAGSLQWASKAGGASDDYAHGIAVDGSGNAYITGSFSGSGSFGSITLTGNEWMDIFLAKYDASGNVIWAQRSGGTGPDIGKGVAVDNAGNVYITGSFFGTASFGDLTLTGHTIDIDILISENFIAKYNASGVVQWAQKFGGASAAGSSIAADAAGHVYATGNYRAHAFFGDVNFWGSGYIYVAKLDGAGNAHWAKAPLGYTSFNVVRSIAADKDGSTYVTGLYRGNITFGNFTLPGYYDETKIFIAKYDPSGNVLWARSAGGYLHDAANSITLDGSGNAYITGYFYSTISFGNINLTGTGGSNTFVAKYDATGQVLWAQKAGGTSSSSGAGITTDKQGNLYVAGNFTGSATFGSTTLTASGGSNAYVAKYDASGNVLWAQKAGVNNTVNGISVDGSGNIYTTGDFSGTATIGNSTLISAGGYDLFVASYDASGNAQWAKSAGGTANAFAFGITADASGNTYLTGYFGGTANFDNNSITGDGGMDIFLAKYDASGNVQWVQKAGGTNSDSGYGITADESGNAYLTGAYSGTASFGATTITSAGGYDIFVAKYDAAGNAQWTLSTGGTGSDTGVGIALDGKGNAYVAGTFQDSFTLGSNTLTSNGTDIFVMKIANAGVPTGMAQSKVVSSLLLYPNPVRDKLHLHLPVSNSIKPELRLLDSNGKLLLQHQYTALTGDFNQELDLSSLAKGVYLLQVQTDREVITKLIVKE